MLWVGCAAARLGDDDLFPAAGTAGTTLRLALRNGASSAQKTDTTDQPLFGNFDGHGRTDVVALHGGQLLASWRGISDR